MMGENKYGTLYVIATPIGNLEDITLRAIRTLKEVDFILCEDKRVTVKLLNRYQIKTNLMTLHKFNESKSQEQILTYLQSGKNLALVSDAGTPLVSDPGLKLISFLRINNIKIVPIPGPSALTSALSICPLPVDKFLFVGFLPDEKLKRWEMISTLSSKSKNIILFIAPHDLNKYLKEIYSLYSDAEVFFARELTKVYEESWFGKIKDLIDKVENKKIKGEIVLFLSFNDKNLMVSDSELIRRLKSLIKSGQSLKAASKLLSKEFNLSSKKLYDMYLRAVSRKP